MTETINQPYPAVGARPHDTQHEYDVSHDIFVLTSTAGSNILRSNEEDLRAAYRASNELGQPRRISVQRNDGRAMTIHRECRGKSSIKTDGRWTQFRKHSIVWPDARGMK